MFTEYFENEQWDELMPGISTCIIGSGADDCGISPNLQPGRIEVIYCLDGTASLKRENGMEGKLGPREILLVADSEQIQSVEISIPLKGVCLSIDTARAEESLKDFCHSFGDLALSMRHVAEIMKTTGGFRVLSVTPWSRAAFYTLKSIPQSSWSQYCILKTFEMFYLMCIQNSGMDTQADAAESGSYLSGIAENMRSYMEEHLDEKLTILDLSRRFHLSRTACKSCFRSCYGQPIHSWILDRRMEQATDLLEHTNMPVLQIAQSVGYSGVSQFNAAFKQRYGKTPREYRKMSASEYS